ncbi:GNAT family N-acetyltransferase [Kineosporia babensis]|uniref:GNAT family N-acetyltransferase n=1 Tax=Kineosporia babensis TaxID=499548 RepID=A0A9X1SSB5_9ACTN|nr:GNAT family N-acetyltransferase [Kineosporia babensis]
MSGRLEDDDGGYWSLYENAFDDLRSLAVQRHLMLRAEFDELMQDKRVTKYAIRDPELGRAAALAAVTTNLDAVHLISPEYFQRRWPNLYEQQRIWYVSFVAVDPAYQGTGAMTQLIEMVCRDAEGAAGLICLDICEHATRARLAGVLEQLTDNFLPGVQRVRLDAQVFWGYEFPEPKTA